MKTKILIFAGLICGGLIFTSCQKDNALIEDTNFEQVADSPKSGFTNSQANWEDIGNDPISNYPDPFKMYTTIRYIVKIPSQVHLAVYNKNYELVKVLVDEFQSEGTKMTKFNSQGLPAGVYTAVLKVGSKIWREKMTKKPLGGIIEHNSSVDIED